uniref:Uncharacterized protein n=1 Tax=Candidatus Kentrum eta TaxID=2126337 RepID=A0A450UFC2_9GAMM|nr:MAG: hypothetical protein BECKH772A_GA0070896_100171 [Candidatus Kentron sp. H]VFJ91250.1 MAG: hypothetical protein BECKH772B_GA0070898_100161 [Candidatus Kentron sp. H]VFJ97786.1 MAG: hypothetical protein BECKH772C_GA0070978_100161 [Candidatus Kentron sp. H]
MASVFARAPERRPGHHPSTHTHSSRPWRRRGYPMPESKPSPAPSGTPTPGASRYRVRSPGAGIPPDPAHGRPDRHGGHYYRPYSRQFVDFPLGFTNGSNFKSALPIQNHASLGPRRSLARCGNLQFSLDNRCECANIRVRLKNSCRWWPNKNSRGVFCRPWPPGPGRERHPGRDCREPVPGMAKSNPVARDGNRIRVRTRRPSGSSI